MSQDEKKAEQWPPAESTLCAPEFLTQRVDRFYNERVMHTWKGGHIMRGKIPEENAIHLSSNDYLALTNHPKIIDAQVKTLLESGNGQMMSAIFLKGDNLQRDFELKMAKFIHAEDVLTTQSGWCANTGLIQSIADATTPIYIDMFAHMSLWEGIQSAGAKARPFRHNDPQHLERQIKRNGQGIVIVDSVYSTNGDVCPLSEIVAVATKHNCIMIVDESHSLGSHGHHGEGMVASLGLADKVHFRTASLAKAFCGRGGIIACSARQHEYLVFESRPAIFSSAVLPHDLAGFSATIDIIKRENWRRTKLFRNADYVRHELAALGYNVTASKSQIISLEAGSEENVIVLRDALEKHGIFGAIFCAPATPKNRALMRFSIHAGLSREQLDKIVHVCADIRQEVELAAWPSTRRLSRDLQGHKTKTAIHPETPKQNVYALQQHERKKPTQRKAAGGGE